MTDKETIDHLQQQLAAAREALSTLSIGSCTCYTKTSDIKYHEVWCDYRIIEKALLLTQPEQKGSDFMKQKPKSRTPTMDKYQLHSIGGYVNDPKAMAAIDALRARWAALSEEDRKKAHEEAESLRTPDGPGR